VKLAESWSFAVENLREMKLRAALTTLGVMVGIGALVAMIGFGSGLQKNVTESFVKLDLLNSMTVLPGQGGAEAEPGADPDRRPRGRSNRPATGRPLDDAAVAEIAALGGVVSAFPEERFPVLAGKGAAAEFRLVQVLPAAIISTKAFRLSAGRAFRDDDEQAVIVGPSVLRILGVKGAAEAIGRPFPFTSLSFDLGLLAGGGLAGLFGGTKSPLKRKDYEFPIVGVIESMFMGESSPLAGDIILPAGAAARIDKLPFTSVWDLFRVGEGKVGYSAVNVRLESPAYADPVKAKVRAMGFGTFALVDQLEQVKTGFVYMNMMLAAVGMIAIFVAALGIVNTMVMSILERYGEIGIMKAVGAARRDIRQIFLLEASLLGFAGGVGGLALGWTVSRIINRVVNYFLARQGMPFIEYFRFPLWLCLGGIAFAVGVSLVAGVYPALRAARVDPVVALRHE
jgi:ABC-type antimicrobial peptide transport system permease subunit